MDPFLFTRTNLHRKPSEKPWNKDRNPKKALTKRIGIPYKKGIKLHRNRLPFQCPAPRRKHQKLARVIYPMPSQSLCQQNKHDFIRLWRFASSMKQTVLCLQIEATWESTVVCSTWFNYGLLWTLDFKHCSQWTTQCYCVIPSKRRRDRPAPPWTLDPYLLFFICKELNNRTWPQVRE